MTWETRPWGRYKVIASADTFQIKIIEVNSNHRLSYQKHERRAEHWFITEGTATIVIDGETYTKHAGESVDITIGQAHRIGNLDNKPLMFIEVQTGSYFGEDDIFRLYDDYGRE